MYKGLVATRAGGAAASPAAACSCGAASREAEAALRSALISSAAQYSAKESLVPETLDRTSAEAQASVCASKEDCSREAPQLLAMTAAVAAGTRSEGCGSLMRGSSSWLVPELLAPSSVQAAGSARGARRADFDDLGLPNLRLFGV